jgi:hypothetical protein
MSLITEIKEKVSNPKQDRKGKSFDEEMQNLDLLIEDLFKMDSGNAQQVKESEES